MPNSINAIIWTPTFGFSLLVCTLKGNTLIGHDTKMTSVKTYGIDPSFFIYICKCVKL